MTARVRATLQGRGRIPFSCYTYPRTTRKEDLLLLKDAGCKSMTVGIQSGSFGVLKEYNRPVQPDTALTAARLMVECGLEGFFEMITRSEYDTEERLRETFEFMRDANGDEDVRLYPMVKFPEYGYTEKVQSQQLKITISDEDYLYYHKLYLLTRSELPRSVVRRIGKSRAVRRLMRRFPNLIDPLLPKTLPLFQLGM